MTSKESSKGGSSQSRRGFLQTAAAGVVGLVVGGAAGYASRGASPGMATTMTMTQTVTQAASGTMAPAVQGATTSARAIAGIQALKASGVTLPAQLNILGFAGTDATFTSSAQTWENATGIKINVIDTPIESAYDKVMLESTAKSGAYDVFVVNFVNMGDYLASGVIVPVDDWVAKYSPVLSGQPDGYVWPTGLHTTTLGTHILGLDIDTDTHTAYYRKSMMQDPAEQETFEKQFGYPLDIPLTWDQYHDVISFFHRPDKGIFGSYEFRQTFWAWRNWNYRYSCKKYPSMYYFDNNMHPLINGPEGIKATEQYADVAKYTDPEFASLAWTENFSRYAAGKGFSNINFPSLAKFCNLPSLSKIVGDLLYAIPPGEMVSSDLGQNVLLHRNTHAGSWTCYISAYGKNPEVAYLYTQFLTSPEIIPIASSAPGSFADPARYSQSISSTQVGPFPYDFLHGQPYDYVARTALCTPDITFQGANEYQVNLDHNLSAVCAGTLSAADAMSKTATQWEATTDRLGRDTLIPLWQQLMTWYPSTSF